MKNDILGRILSTSFVGFGALLCTAGLAAAANITPGNVVVVRVGDGVGTLTNAASAVFLEEYTPTGTLVQTLPLPIAASGLNQAFVTSGSATSEGFLNQTTNGNYLIMAGYGVAPGTLTVSANPSSLVPRVVARIDLTGAIDTTTALSDAYSGATVRSVASDDGNQFWLTGSSGGVRYATPLGALLSTQINTTAPTNLRVANIDAGQLYTSSASGTFQGVGTVGTGLPNTSGQTLTLLTGFPTATGPQSYDYWFADPNTLYVADDRTNGSGGIQKWTLSAGTWSNVYNLAPNATTGCRGLSGVNNAGTVTLYATTSVAAPNQLVSVVDTGAGSAFTTLATAGTNQVFRGVRLVAGGSPTGPGTYFCFGDGAGTACPCANSGAAGNGCANSLNPAGGNLNATGAASVGADTLVLGGSGVPNGPGLYYQAVNQLGGGNGVLFGDGLRCIGSSVIRLGIVGAAGNASTYPSPNPPVANSIPVSVKGFCAAGDIRNYQLWYRDSDASFCTASVFNLTNAVNIVWQP